MTRFIQLSTVCVAPVLAICVGQNVHPALAQTNEHPLPPPSVPESIAPQYYSGISFQDEYDFAGAAKEKLLDALNSKCLSAAARDAAAADAERAIHQIEEWAKYHPDETGRSWAGYWRGPLQKYLALLKQKKKCVETGTPGVTQPAPPQETTPPPTEGERCLTPEEKKNKIIDLKFEITKTEVDRTILQKDLRVVNETIESAKGQIETMDHLIKHPDADKGEGNEGLDPRTVKADEEAKLRDAQLERARIERELEANRDERLRLNNQLESLIEQEVCPDDRHSSKGNPLNDVLGHVSIGIGVGGNGHEDRFHDEGRRNEKLPSHAGDQHDEQLNRSVEGKGSGTDSVSHDSGMGHGASDRSKSGSPDQPPGSSDHQYQKDNQASPSPQD